jgi:hypothetical protein
MSQILSTENYTNFEWAGQLIKEIEDSRERALAYFLMNQAMFAVNQNEAIVPSSPIDFLYLVQIAKAMYRNKVIMQNILNGDADSYNFEL